MTFVERPHENEKDRALSYVSSLLNQFRNTKEDRTADIQELESIAKILATKKYGLVWEEHAEKVEEYMKSNIPIFVEDRSKKINRNPNSENFNFILEGDNLHSLHLLEKTHRNKIDMIYIDPPYNTGNSLTYNDKRVGEDDVYIHSKWLSFMERRLKISRNLLNEQGLIFISIDDNEGYNLKVLCDEIFNEKNFMGSFSITKAEGGGQAKYLVKGHDLILIYAKNLSKTKPLGRPKDVRGSTFEKNGEIYWIQEDAYRKVFGKYGNLHYEEILEFKDQKFKDDIDKKIADGDIILLDKGKEGHILGKVRKLSNDYSKYHSVLKQLNSDGKNDLSAFGLEDIFDYPKPVNLIKELIAGTAFLRPGKLTVLDFFAGSGTTGQAVLEFAKESGRDVSFILCTNNEVSAKQKLKFVQHFGNLKTYNPSNQTSDSAIERKINLELNKKNTTLAKMIEENEDTYQSYGICQSVTYPRIKDVIYGFDRKNKGNKILFKKRLSESVLKKIDPILEKIEEIKENEPYSNYKLKIDDTANLVLSTEVKANDHYNAISSNVKYFKTDFVEKQTPDLENILLDNVKTLIELKYGISLEYSNIAIVTKRRDIEYLDVSNLSTIYMRSQTHKMLDRQQLEVLKEIKIIDIPEAFFPMEMREAGL